MDTTLHPQIVILGNRHYRKNVCSIFADREDNEYLDGEPFDLTENDHTLNSDELIIGLIKLSVPIKPTDKGCTCSIEVPKYFHRFIVGPNRSNLLLIQKETSSKITLPSQTSSSKSIVITAANKASIVSACNRIAAKVALERKKADPSHFLSIPLSESVSEAFAKLKEELINNKDKYNIDEADMMSISKLHFTICTMFLADDDEVNIAKNAIKEFILTKDFIKNFDQGCIRLSIKGLEIMNDDVSRARIVYAKPVNNEALDRLQIICNQLQTKCSSAGLLSGQNSFPVKIHMTVLNAKRSAKQRLKASLNEDELAKMDSWSKSTLFKKLDSHMSFIDATEIFKRFSQYTFAEYFPLEEIQMAVRNVPGDVYPSAASIRLPQEPKALPIFVDS